jgi:glutamine amidotransferase
MIAIIDYEIGNVGSVLNILKKIKAEAIISSRPADLLQASKIILPGVGSFDDAMKNLKRLEYLPVLNHCVLEKKIPILGICMGMQLFTKGSEEGQEAGFGWLDAETVRFNFDEPQQALKVPHMGWNTVDVRQCTPFFEDLDAERRFYFVHSYHVRCNDPADVLTSTSYGIDFTSAVCRGNILGAQFHPEKSHRFGMEFFKAFAQWSPTAGQRG